MKLLSLFFLFSLLLFSKDIAYEFHLSNSTPYRGEATFLDVNITQENHERVMRFQFTLNSSQSYEFHQIAFKERDDYHALKHHYRYLIYAKEEGRVDLEFKMIKSLTDDDKVAYAISGDRDNVKGLVKKDSLVVLNPLPLQVKSLPKGTELVGDYQLSYELDRTSTEAYEPIHLKVLLKGEGNIAPLEILRETPSYHLFTEAPKVKTFHNARGSQNSIEWNYAISAKEDFTLPKVLLKAFDPKSKRSYELTIPPQKIQVNQVAKASLLDQEDTPSIASSTDWSWLGWLLSYLAVFMAGFLLPRDILQRGWRRELEVVEEDEIERATTHKELLQLLLFRNHPKDREAIGLLEDVVYRGKELSLSKIKNSINVNGI